MHRREIAAVVILALAALSPAMAQSPLPDTNPGPAVAPPSDQETKTPVRSDRDSFPDARVCLELPTNIQIIKCAEKYRMHKRKKR